MPKFVLVVGLTNTEVRRVRERTSDLTDVVVRDGGDISKGSKLCRNVLNESAGADLILVRVERSRYLGPGWFSNRVILIHGPSSAVRELRNFADRHEVARHAPTASTDAMRRERRVLRTSGRRKSRSV